MKKSIAAVLSVTIALAGCVSGAIDSANFNNAAKVHLFTPEEQNAMTAEGTIPTMLAPSEIREHFEKIRSGKNTKPTGAVNYCGAGLSSLVQSRRNAALAAIDAVCGGTGKYTIKREGSGYMEVSHVGNVRIGASCNRPMSIYFRCNGVQPNPTKN
jgi:PBP1b-binding outer membrane lipoprotein LpoB